MVTTKNDLNTNNGRDPYQETLDLWKRHNYDCLGTIGFGSFGRIYEVKSKDYRNSLAVKIIQAGKISEGEKTIWPKLNHNSITPVIASSYYPTTDTWAFFMPKFQSDLACRLQDLEFKKDVKSFNRSLSYLKDIVNGLSYLHKKGIYHMDIRSNNILISDNDSASITDFGYAQERLLYTDKYGVPVAYCPPEVQITAENRTTVQGFHFDEYTLGMLILEMLTANALYECFRKNTILDFDWIKTIYPLLYKLLKFKKFKTLLRRTYPKCMISSDIMRDVLDVIMSLIHINPQKRISVLELKRFKLFGGTETYVEDADSIWLKKVNYPDLKKIIALYAVSPLDMLGDELINQKPKSVIGKSSRDIED